MVCLYFFLSSYTLLQVTLLHSMIYTWAVHGDHSIYTCVLLLFASWFLEEPVILTTLSLRDSTVLVHFNIDTHCLICPYGAAGFFLLSRLDRMIVPEIKLGPFESFIYIIHQLYKLLDTRRETYCSPLLHYSCNTTF